MIETLRYIILRARLAVVEHQSEAGALVSRTLLGAVGDVAAIGRIERCRVAGGIVGGNVLGLASADWDYPQVVVGGSRRILVMIRRVANLLPVRREGVVILPAEREHRRVVVAGREIERVIVNMRAAIVLNESGAFSRNHEQVAALPLLVCVPVAIE